MAKQIDGKRIAVLAEVPVDGALVTSRTPADLPAFCSRLIGQVREARPPSRLVHAGATTA